MAVDDDMEREANEFAMELLMPSAWLKRDAAGIDMGDDEALAKLAKKYKVPVGLLCIRLGQLIPIGKAGL